MLTRDEILSNLEQMKKVIRHKYKAELKGFFGSYARGEEKENSDLDILVKFDEDADLFDFAGLSMFLEEKLNCKVDVVPESNIREEIKQYILKEAIYI